MLIKKRTLYLIVALMPLPLVSHAVTLPPIDGADLRPMIQTLASSCAPLPKSLDESAINLLTMFYERRQGQPAWSNEASTQALQQQINQLADDGLQPTDYPLPSVPLNASVNLRDCADLLTSHAYLRALQDLRYGRLYSRQLEPLWRAPEVNMRPAAEVTILPIALANTEQPEHAFSAARPKLEQYQRLRVAYAAQRTQPLAQWQPIPGGPLLRPGAFDPRVPALRERLNAEGYTTGELAETANQFDPGTVSALQIFQSRHGLQDDGVLGPASINELNISALTRRDQLRINLERLRWLAYDLEHAVVAINVAGAEVMIMQDGSEVWRSRTQVGRESRKTPLLVSRINRLTLNPTWTVPPTIWREDKLPAIRNDIGYLARHQMNVYDRQGNRLDPYSIDWSSPGGVMLRQEAGVNNPLGRVVLRFDNPFAVYLHDTPSQSLFNKSPRVFSSGCVRVEAIQTLLSKILDSDHYDTVQARIAKGRTSQYRLPESLPLVIAYWTAEVGDDGVLRYLPDMYGNDPALVRAQLTSQKPNLAGR
ncbi:MAG: L,D-transpeptidase family protein [Pseudomonas marincola]|uniref:L,D-transpeptidase family protein n=1 Tax=Pseudomonas marincola TaxID=437900 RepID=UPI003002D1BF